MNEESYWGIHKWSEGYFDVNAEGNVIIKPNPNGPSGDLYQLVKTLVARGIEPPILIRFNGIIKDRIDRLHAAFDAAIQDLNYKNTYRMAYPIKVNPQRHVVETVQLAGKNRWISLEVGSKPELIAVLALESDSNLLLLCNGYKDTEYISLALMSLKLGRNTLIIIEQEYELKLVLQVAEKLGVEAQIGFRMKLSSKGTGRWMSSGGENSKFGLFTHEIVSCLNQLQEKSKTHWLKLLHFHMGSQITSIEAIKKALKEASRMYTELAHIVPSLTYFDVGGGLAVDYDGTKSISDSSMNYSLEEYARDVVDAIGTLCAAEKLKDPIIISESGRAIVTHHSLLIIEVIDVSFSLSTTIDEQMSHDIIENFLYLLSHLTLKNCRETFHDAIELKERILEEFIHGKLKLKERAQGEKLYRKLLVKIQALLKQLPDLTDDLETINKILIETYFCNFSLFQSLPDSWAIDQLFPIMPIHRLKEVATHPALLADLSCDSDGKIDTFIGKKYPVHHLMLHTYPEAPYYLGIFLVGAYQEILGGLHNLFGDTNVVHAQLDEESGKWELSGLVEGDTIQEVLSYVQYKPEQLMNQLHTLIENSLKNGTITPAESAEIKKKFKQSLESYTYLVV